MRLGRSRVRRLASRLGLAAGLAAGLGAATAAQAGEPVAPTTAGAAANPFANPYLNPYMNPYMTSQSMTPQASLLYFMAAQRATGGIGSGKLSGSRPDSAPAPNGTEDRRPSPRGATRREPAGTAAGYFQRGYSTTRPDRPMSFGRSNRYFPDNGR